MDIFQLILLFIQIGLLFAIVYIPYKVANAAIRGMAKSAKKTWHTIRN